MSAAQLSIDEARRQRAVLVVALESVRELVRAGHSVWGSEDRRPFGGTWPGEQPHRCALCQRARAAFATQAEFNRQLAEVHP